MLVVFRYLDTLLKLYIHEHLGMLVADVLHRILYSWYQMGNRVLNI